MNRSRQLIDGIATMPALALQHWRHEGEDLIAQAAAREPAKVLARKTGLTERHIRGLRQRQHAPGWETFMALAQQAPELRAAVARWLGLAPGPESAALRARLEKLLAETPEEGDRSND